MEDRTGQWLAGRYRLERRIATDKTGDRYDAWDGAALLRVTIAFLAPALLESPDAFARYERQVNQLRILANRNIVALRGIERDGVSTFLVADVGAGPSLRTVMQERRTPFSPSEAARILGPVAVALDALRGIGLAHRHVAPETIAVRGDGTGMLAEPAFVPPEMDGAIFGPSAFLSPEQGSSREATGASDVYALGAVLYEMLTDISPFTGEVAPQSVPNAWRVHWEQVNRPPAPPRAHTPGLSSHLDRVILSALNPNPAARPSTASDLIAAIVGDGRGVAAATTALPRGSHDTVANLPSASARTPPAGYGPPDEIDQTGMILVPDTLGEVHAVRRRSPLLTWVLVVLTLLVLASASLLGVLVVKRNQTLTRQQDHYAVAEAALAQNAYDVAIAEFAAAGTYRDAPARAQAAQATKEQQANYEAGTAAFGREDYVAAADAFGKAGTFRDAAQRRTAALRLGDQKQAYAEGVNALAKEDYATAATAFARAADYKDAPTQTTKAQNLIGQQQQYQTGKDALAKEDYTTAAAAFRAATTYKDAPQLAIQAENLRTQKAAYDAGVVALSREDFKTAKQQFGAAGEYKDAKARAAQADQEDMLLTAYTSAQTHLRASQWKEAYADLQAIKKVRPDYRDVSAVIAHLENDVVNPTMVDIAIALAPSNGYKEGWVPVNNLIGQPVTWLYVTSRQSVEGRPDQVSALSLSLVPTQGSKEAMNSEIPVLAANNDLRDKNALRAGEKLSVLTDKGQTTEVAEFGKYRARLTVTNLGFPLKIAGNDSAGTTTAFFSRLTIDVTLIPKTP